MTSKLSGEFVDGLAAGRVRYQLCGTCDTAQTLTRYACVSCGSDCLKWIDSSGRGVVHAVTVVSRAPSDLFRPLVPYTLVIVTLEEGPRVMGHGTPGLTIGQAVTAGVFNHGGRVLLHFFPSDGAVINVD
jgi:hypothetical protein